MEDKPDNMEEKSEEALSMYTVRELAEMRLPGLPDTERAWLDRAKNGKWKFKEVPGRGRGGKKKVYLPPPEIMKLIKERQRMPMQGSDKQAVCDVKKKLPQEPNAVHLFLIAMIVADADWLPDSVKQNEETKIALATQLFGFLRLFLWDSDERWEWVFHHREALQDALRFVYAMEQMESELTKTPTKK